MFGTVNRASRNFENIIGGLVILLMMSGFYFYAEKLAVAAERESIQQTLSVIRQGINVFMFHKMISGESLDFRQFRHGNPVTMLSVFPGNYAGEFSAEDAASAPAGKWFFERDSRQLVYRPAYADALNKSELRFRLEYDVNAQNSLPLRLLEVSD